MLKILGTMLDGTMMYHHPIASHSHRPDLDAEVIAKLSIADGQTFLRTTVDLGHIIGVDHLVETDEYDEIVFARRGNRAGNTRFVLNQEANPTTKVTIVACVDRDPGETQGKWCLVTLFEGEPGCREPWDASLKTEEAKAEAEAFWANHALVPTDEEIRGFDFVEMGIPLYSVIDRAIEETIDNLDAWDASCLIRQDVEMTLSECHIVIHNYEELLEYVEESYSTYLRNPDRMREYFYQ